MEELKIIEWSENWSIDNDIFYFVIFLDKNDNFVGKGIVEYKGEDKKNLYCSLYHVYVNEKYRGQGYFRQLIEKCLEDIKKKEYNIVGLYAKKELITIYEEYGFEFNGKMNSDKTEYSGYLNYNDDEE